MLSSLHAVEREHLGANEIMVPAQAMYQAGGKTRVVCRCPICALEHETVAELPFGLVKFKKDPRCRHRVSAVIGGGTPAFATEADMRAYAELARGAQTDALWRYAQRARGEPGEPGDS